MGLQYSVVDEDSLPERYNGELSGAEFMRRPENSGASQSIATVPNGDRWGDDSWVHLGQGRLDGRNLPWLYLSTWPTSPSPLCRTDDPREGEVNTFFNPARMRPLPGCKYDGPTVGPVEWSVNKRFDVIPHVPFHGSDLLCS